MCSLPIENVRHILALVTFAEDPYECVRHTGLAPNPLTREEREICDHCYAIIIDIFNHRLENNSKELRSLYQTNKLPARTPKHELKKKPKKEKNND